MKRFLIMSSVLALLPYPIVELMIRYYEYLMTHHDFTVDAAWVTAFFTFVASGLVIFACCLFRKEWFGIE